MTTPESFRSVDYQKGVVNALVCSLRLIGHLFVKTSVKQFDVCTLIDIICGRFLYL